MNSCETIVDQAERRSKKRKRSHEQISDETLRKWCLKMNNREIIEGLFKDEMKHLDTEENVAVSDVSEQKTSNVDIVESNTAIASKNVSKPVDGSNRSMIRVSNTSMINVSNTSMVNVSNKTDKSTTIQRISSINAIQPLNLPSPVKKVKFTQYIHCPLKMKRWSVKN
eukprot:UN27655